MRMRRHVVMTLVALAAGSTAGLAAGPTTMTWTVDGVERQALVFAPSVPATTGAAKAPVIFGFHGHGGTMQGTAGLMRFQQLWPAAVVVYPQGLPAPSHVDPQGTRPGWQTEPGQLGDRDLKFFDAMLAGLHAKFNVDDDRVYVSGFSNGAIFSFLLWGTRGKALAAVGICAGILPLSVSLVEPRPVVHIAGQADQTATFSLQVQSMETERQVDGCSGPGQACGNGCKVYASSKHAPVMNVVHPGGHVYPPWASGRFVAFFKAHPRQP